MIANKLLTSIIAIFMMSLPAAAQAQTQPSLNALYDSLDNAIAHSAQYVALRKDRIKKLEATLATATTRQDSFECCSRLYDEYRPYNNDRAMSYISRCVTLARSMGDGAKETHAMSMLALQASSTGNYCEARDVLHAIDAARLDGEGRKDYLWACHHLYSEMAYYAGMTLLKDSYRQQADTYRQQLEQLLAPNDDRLLQMHETALRDAGRTREALAVNDSRLAQARPGTHGYAIVMFYRALIYRNAGEQEQCRRCFLQSAISDVRLAVMDQGSLWELAHDIMADDSMLGRSYDYIKFAWQSATTFNTALRSRQIMPVLSTIEESYQKQLTESNRRLKIMIACSLALVVIVMALLLYVNKQRKRIAQAHRRQKATNEQLKTANEQLNESNTRLKAMNIDLNESNRMKEVYIGRFMRLCSAYVDKIEAMRKRVLKLVKTHEYARLTAMMQDDHEYVGELYEHFDSAFLKLFPSFVAEFNALLKPEERIVPDDSNKLTTMIRIFALIRLGIEDSSKIAEFLHYSVNTIYNYRAKVKNGALCDRDEFEENVKKIGMK